MRLIDADEAIEALMINKQINDAKNQILAADEDSIIEWLKKRPSAQPERIKGRWTKAYDGYDGHVKCVQCFKTYDWDTQAQYYNFCPNCGADMRGEQDAAD